MNAKKDITIKLCIAFVIAFFLAPFVTARIAIPGELAFAGIALIIMLLMP